MDIERHQNVIKLCARLVKEDHSGHENIIRDLRKAADPYSIPFLKQAVLLKPRLDYLEYDDYGSYYKKCFRALGAIGTPEAIAVIQEFTTSDDAAAREQAIYRISEIESDKQQTSASDVSLGRFPMNRVFGIIGFLAVGVNIFLACFMIAVGLFFCRYGPDSESARTLLIFSTMSAVLAVPVFLFFRYSLKDHCAALCRTTPIRPIAWRGVSSVYCLLLIVSVLTMYDHIEERRYKTDFYLCVCVAIPSLILGVISVRKGFCRKTRNVP